MATIERDELLGLVAEMFERNSEATASLIRSAISDPCVAAAVDENVTDVDRRKKLVLDFLATRSTLPGLGETTAAGLAVLLLCPIEQLEVQIARVIASNYDLHATVSYLNAAIGAAKFFLAKGTMPNTPTASRRGSPKTTATAAAETALAKPTTALGDPSNKESTPAVPSPLTAPPMAPPTTPPPGPSQPKRKAQSPTGSSPSSKKTKATTPTTPPGPVASLALPQSPNTEAKARARNRSAVAATYRRDGNVCVLSGYAYPDAAHIFPFSASNDKAMTLQTLDLLAVFWGQEAAAAWQKQCLDSGISESPKNILCLSKHMHALWGAARFGLKPLRDPQAAARNEVHVQFHWLHQGRHKPSDIVDASAAGQLVAQMAMPGPDAGGFATSASDGAGNERGRNGTLAHRQSGLRIETGQVFVFTADDPENLPSLDLLELQWHLVRLAAMSGAANVDTSSVFRDEGATGCVAENPKADADADADADVESLWLSDEGEEEDGVNAGLHLGEMSTGGDSDKETAAPF